MRTFIIRLLLVSVSMIAATLQAQNITFNHLTTDDGLSQFSVNSLYIDENGVLWIGTREGLNRYDGEDIQTYKLQKNDPYSLSATPCCAWPATVTENLPALYGRSSRVQSCHPKIHHPAARKCTQHILQRGPFHRKTE